MGDINKIITIHNGTKYMVLDQTSYDGKSYLLVSELDKEDNVTETISIFEQGQFGSEQKHFMVNDRNLYTFLIDYFKTMLLLKIRF